MLAGLVVLVAAACASEGVIAPSRVATATTIAPTVLPATATPIGVPEPTADASTAPVPATVTSEPMTPTSTAVATLAPETPTPPVQPSIGRSVELARIGALVSEIRELSEAGTPNVELVDKDRIASELAEDLEDPEVLADIADLELLLKLLGLIPQDEDLLDIERRLLEGAVIGLYNTETGELLVLGDGDEVSVKEESVYSHEYTHLLQDVNFGIKALADEAEDDSERSGALQALVEGEATFIEAIYAGRHFSNDEFAELLVFDPEDIAVLEATPDVLVSLLQWPYTVGFAFVNSIWQQGGMSAIDAVWGDLPETTEQIIHPEKYALNEFPAAVPVLPDLAAALGGGWEERYTDVLGEAFISIWLESLGADGLSAAQAAAGWGSDSYVVLESSTGETAFGVSIEWDEPGTDALQFSTALEQSLDDSAVFGRIERGDVTTALWMGQGGVLAFGLNETTGAAGVGVAPTADEAAALLGALTRD